MHAIRDALNLGKALGKLDSTDVPEIGSLLGPYQKEMLERGVAAVQGSRNAQRVNAGVEGEIIAWGQVAMPMPEKSISLESCRA